MTVTRLVGLVGVGAGCGMLGMGGSAGFSSNREGTVEIVGIDSKVFQGSSGSST